jgi:DGQHR domain-containing protein
MSFQDDLPVKFIAFSTLEEAQQRAGAEVANTGGFALPVVVFRQGLRTHVTGALPMAWVRSRLETRSARPRSSLADTQVAWNRPEDPAHARAIADYLKANYAKKYILPPLTLNVQHPVNLYTLQTRSQFHPGYLVIPATAKLAITDGQHRRTGIITALDELSENDSTKFAQDAVAVMITCETDLDQIHQDFADCSKTKQLPPSLLAIYDRRNPANRLVGDLEARCRLFRKRIDATSRTLSSRSIYLFLANQLRQFVKELVLGSYATPDQQFERMAIQRLGEESQYIHAMEKYVGYVERLTDVIPIWKEIAELEPQSLAANQIPMKRAEGWVCLTATGLNLIGRVGFYLFSDPNLSSRWEQYADRLGEVDWRRSAEIWQGNIIQNGRVVTQQAPLRVAFSRVRELIGL